MRILRRRSNLPMALALIGMLVGCATTARSQQAARHESHDWTPPSDAAGKANPLAGRTELAAGGQKLFRQRCAQCHAEDGIGSPRAPDLTRRAVQAQSDGALFWRISAGNAYAGMPSFSYLPELQRWQLVLHLRTMTSTATTALQQSHE
jgi:mono/diheme cytochrome c family protein